MSQNDDDFFDTAAEVDAEIMEESTEMACLQRARGMTDHVMGTAADIDGEEKEGSVTRERSHLTKNLIESHLTKNLIDQATGEVNAIFGGGNVWGNDSVPLPAPLTLGFYSGAELTTMQHATQFMAGGNAPNARMIAASLHQMLMGGTPT